MVFLPSMFENSASQFNFNLDWNKKMNFHVFLTFLSIGCLFNEVASSCPESKFTEVLDSTQKCIATKAAETLFGNVEICTIIDNIFVTCAELLRECLNEEEHRYYYYYIMLLI